MGQDELPLLIDVYPGLVEYLESTLIADGDGALAQAARELRFHGWCTCSDSCRYLKTAPYGVAVNAWVELEGADGPYVWLQLSEGHTSFAGMEICELTLGSAPETDPLRPTHVA